MLDTVFKIINVFAQDKNINLVVEMSPDIPDVLIGDQLRIRQILTNLLNNAVKFTDKGTVMLRIELIDLVEEQIRLRFCVEDTGVGIAKGKQEILFEKYTQAETSTTRKHGGTGLGLNIARMLVELMGGKIDLTSEEGKGSRFFFTINLITGDHTYNPAELKADPPLKYNRVRVLLVSALEELKSPFKTIFDFWKIETAFASSPDEAAKRLAENPFDVVFLDFCCNEENIREAISQIEKAVGNAGTRLVFLYKEKVNTEINRLKKLEKYGFLNKPVLQRDLRDFAARLERLFPGSNTALTYGRSG